MKAIGTPSRHMSRSTRHRALAIRSVPTAWQTKSIPASANPLLLLGCRRGDPRIARHPVGVGREQENETAVCQLREELRRALGLERGTSLAAAGASVRDVRRSVRDDTA